LLLAVITLTAFSLGSRTPLGLDIIRDRNSLYRIVDGGQIENVYSLRIMNMDDRPHTMTVSVTGSDGMTVETDPATVRIEAGAIEAIAARVRAPAGTPPGGQDIRFEISSTEDSSLTVAEPTRFMTPLTRQ
jgi:polyferredoxin